jgi:hypothetical protein
MSKDSTPLSAYFDLYQLALSFLGTRRPGGTW